MKKLSAFLLFLPFIINPVSCIFADENTDNYDIKKYIVTAYYSPLPDQQFYLRGNFEDEIKLNGEGKRGASGKDVYPGMLAAPKTYKFGTKVYLDGVGIGTVDDRGGAIVSSGSRGYDGDRLDIWMGYGDEGLRRALTWGKKVVYGRVISNNNEDILPSIAVEKFQIGKIDTQSLKNTSYVGKNNVEKIKSSKFIVPSEISKSSGSDLIKNFQTIMQRLGYYNGKISGVYNLFIYKTILDFQLANNIVESENSKGAGYYGPKTRQTLNDKYLAFLFQEQEKIANEKKEQERLANLESKIKLIINNLGMPKEDDIGLNVRRLQKTLKLLGYFDGKDTAIYGKLTKESVMKFQIEKGLITSPNDLGAGLIGEKTLSKLYEDLKMIVLNDNTVINDL